MLIAEAEFLQFGGDCARIENCAKMGLHGGKDFRPVSHDAEHVGHVAALGKGFVVERGDLGRRVAAVEPGDSGHSSSCRVFLMVSPQGACGTLGVLTRPALSATFVLEK